MGKESRSFSIDDDIDQQLRSREDVNPSAVVNSFLREYLAAGRAPDAALSMRLERVESQLENARSERARLDSRIERLERERDQIQQKLSERRSQSEEVVEELAAKVEDGTFPRENLHAENPAVQNYASKASLTPDRLVEEVEARL